MVEAFDEVAIRLVVIDNAGPLLVTARAVRTLSVLLAFLAVAIHLGLTLVEELQSMNV